MLYLCTLTLGNAMSEGDAGKLLLSVTSLRDLFEIVYNHVIIDFIKEVHYSSLL